MIRASITVHGPHIEGYAGHREEGGQDVVCAAVSALTDSLVNRIDHQIQLLPGKGKLDDGNST